MVGQQRSHRVCTCCSLFCDTRTRRRALSRPLFRDRIFFLQRFRKLSTAASLQDKLLLSIVGKISREAGYTLNYRLSDPVTWKKIDIKLPLEGSIAQISMLNLECERGGGLTQVDNKISNRLFFFKSLKHSYFKTHVYTCHGQYNYSISAPFFPSNIRKKVLSLHSNNNLSNLSNSWNIDRIYGSKHSFYSIFITFDRIKNNSDCN